ncbi:MAG: rRNA maturation RNase YbeY [Christensenellales bacterium]|jgi:probable rRNA maturation factor
MRLKIEFLWDGGDCLPSGISEAEAEKTCEKSILALLSCDGFSHDALICLRFTSREQIREINKIMRGVDAVTDVLSFPAMKLKPGEKSGFKPRKSQIDVKTGAVFLGDIVLCIERAAEQAEEYGHGFLRETGYLCAHSTAHLLGYDHMSNGEKAMMRALEDKAMALAGLER